MILVFQLIGISFSLLMIYFAVLHFKRKELNLTEIVVWLIAWVFAIIATIFPDILKTFARTFLFARLFDMMVVGSILLVIAMTARSYIVTRKLEKKLEELIRKEAIRNGKRGKKE